MKTDFSKIIILPKNLEVFNIKKGSDYFLLLARKSVFLLRSFFPMGYCDNKRYKEVFGFFTKHKPFYDSWRSIFVDRFAMLYEKNQVLKKLKRDPLYLNKIIEKCHKDGKMVWQLSLKIKKSNLSTKTDKELKNITQKAFEALKNITTYLLVPLSMQGYLEENIKKEINKKIKNEKLVEKYFNILTTPVRGNISYFEQLNVLKIAVLYKKEKCISKNIEREIKSHLLNFGNLGTKYGVGDLWTKKDIIERINYLANKNPEGKLKYLQSFPRENQREANRVLKELRATKEFIGFVKIARTFVYLRTYRTDMLSGAFANFFCLFDEIAQRNNLKRKDVLESLPNEIVGFSFLDKNLIEKRSKENILRGINGKLYLACGNNAKKIVKNIKSLIGVPKKTSKTQKIRKNIIKGATANKGLAKGVVKIVLDNTQLKKVKENDILIAIMTTPDFVPAMERAVAFVTDEGGILCHAAIVSREMKKPCIIGTKIATKVLKDGDLVEVDANKGIVRIIKKS